MIKLLQDFKLKYPQFNLIKTIEFESKNDFFI